MSTLHAQAARVRARWSAIGAAVAVSLGAGGIGLANAAIDSGDKPVTVTVDAKRILDTRTNLGLSGRFADATPRDLQVTGDVAVAPSGTETVVPAGATAVLVNVTVVFPSDPGFLALRSGDAAGAPTTSTVNFFPGSVEPNAATVDLSSDGKVEIWVETSSDSGNAHVLIDVVGYTIDHTHDDRYYTESEVDGAVAAAVAPKANSTDVYTKGEVDAALADKADSADVYTKAESDEYRVGDLEIMGSVASNGNKSSSGPFTSSRSSTGVYFVGLSGLAPLGLPFDNPLMVVSPMSGCNGGTAIGSWSSIGAAGGILTDASMRVEIYDSAGAADDCGYQFSIRFQQPDDLADLLDDTTGARTQSPGKATQRCTNDDSGAVCVDL